jgi:hypothetical protein
MAEAAEGLLEDVPTTTGESYTAEVPDTLDLADRCRMGIHGLAGQTDPHCYYQMWFNVVWASPEPCMWHNGADASCTPKFAESFPLLRTACGSKEYLEIEARQMTNLLASVGADDGIYYNVWKADRPWHSIYHSDAQRKPEDYAWVGGSGRMLRSMMTWRERDGNSSWDDRLRAMARGLGKMAIFRDDYAYYPDGGHSMPFCYPRSGWLNTDEPQSDVLSSEGSVLDSMGHPIYGLARWYMLSGDKEALDLARKLTNFATKPKMWGGLAEEIGVYGNEQGHFTTHNHGHMAALRGLLEYSQAANDQRVMEFVRRSYENLRTFMIPKIGWFPSNGVGDGSWCQSEACNLGDQVALGVRLSDLRLGDYWEDVDAVARNLLVEQQLTDLEKIRAVEAASGPPAPRKWLTGQATYENMPDRIVGLFASGAEANRLPAGSIMGCCSANATQGLYFAWESALRCDGDSAQVNLLLNRASRLADVDSYLPYEGKVVIQNKRARRVSVRILSWIDRKNLKMTVSGQQRPFVWVGNYLLLDDLKTTDRILLTFPVPETKTSYTAHHKVWRHEQVFTYTFRGSTVVEVSPRHTNPAHIAIYDRPHLRSATAPMKKIARYAPDKPLLTW